MNLWSVEKCTVILVIWDFTIIDYHLIFNFEKRSSFNYFESWTQLDSFCDWSRVFINSKKSSWRTLQSSSLYKDRFLMNRWLHTNFVDGFW